MSRAPPEVPRPMAEATARRGNMSEARVNRLARPRLIGRSREARESDHAPDTLHSSDQDDRDHDNSINQYSGFPGPVRAVRAGGVGD
jgi:hypothetical protein